MKVARIGMLAIALSLIGNGPAAALHASATKKNPHLYGYTNVTNLSEVDPDIKELFTQAAKDKASKLVVLGGLHGIKNTGVPKGQAPQENCSFSLEDQANKKGGTGINFTYVNLAKYTTAGSVVTSDKQKDIAKTIKGYLDGG